MAFLQFKPTGFRKWDVSNGEAVIGSISEGSRGLILTTDGRGGLSYLDVQTVVNFMQHASTEDEMERARR
jgi:hypothetical protein